MSVRSEVLNQFKQVAEEQDKILSAARGRFAVLESGLDSLCFAVIVARLEDILGVDPFTAAAEDTPFPGDSSADFVKSYEMRPSTVAAVPLVAH